MITVALLFIVALVGWIFWSRRSGGFVPQPYRARNCQATEWCRSFPSASTEDIREFLRVFVEAFAFRDTEKLKFNPNDGIEDIYRALYPGRETPDALEFNFLARNVERKYGLRLADVWRDGFTLGELFECLCCTAALCAPQPAPHRR
jgi:hypothetical protein